MGSTHARFEVRDFWKYAIQAKHYSWCKKVTSILETVRSVKSRISCQRTVLLAPLTPCNSRACVHRAWQISSRYSSCFRIFISWLKYAFSLSCSWAAWLRRPIDNSAAALCFNLPWAKRRIPCLVKHEVFPIVAEDASCQRFHGTPAQVFTWQCRCRQVRLRTVTIPQLLSHLQRHLLQVTPWRLPTAHFRNHPCA